MNQRVKELRKHLQMNQAEFGERLGVTPTAISKIEIGERKLTVQMAKSICNEFRVNQEWLIHGTGEMFQAFPSPLMEQLAQEFKLDELEQEFIQDFLTLDATERQIIARFLRGSK